MAEESTTPEASSEEAQPECPAPRPVLSATGRAPEGLATKGTTSEGLATEGTTSESGEGQPKARTARATKPAARAPQPRRRLSPEGGVSSSGESRETKRIRAAERTWAHRRARPPQSSDAAAEEPLRTQSYTYGTSCPANSGLFAYAGWVVKEALTSEERAKLQGRTFVYEERRRCPNIDLTVGRMAAAALSRAGAPDITVEGLGAATEADSAVLTPPPESKSPSDIALVTVDCSPKGGADVYLRDYLSYLDATRYEARPKIILIEFSSGRRRAVATEALTSMLERGYAGQLREANGLSFCLPLRCPRTWCVLVKASGFGPKSRKAAEARAAEIVAVVERCQVPHPEHLTEVLARVQTEPSPGADPDPPDARRAGWRQGRKRIRQPAKYPGVDPEAPNGEWPRTFTQYMAQHGLTAAHLETDDGRKLREMLRPILTPRELSKVLLLFADEHRRGQDLRQIAMVCDLGYSNWSASLRCFPELRGGSKYAVLLKGEAFLANCAQCLAVQGLQAAEASSFNLYEKSPLDLMVAICGGLVPNVCFAFLTAALVTVDLPIDSSCAFSLP